MALPGAIGQVDERTAGRGMFGDPTHDFRAQVRRKAGANTAREVQAPLLEVADQNRVEVRCIGLVSADDELLARTELDLDPRIAAFARRGDGIASFRDHSLEAQLPDLGFD